MENEEHNTPENVLHRHIAKQVYDMLIETCDRVEMDIDDLLRHLGKVRKGRVNGHHAKKVMI